MKIFLQIAFLLAVINSVYCAKGYAWCQFQGTSNNPNLTGYAYFIPGPPPSFKIEMHVSVSGIYQNVGVYHGIHIHEFGDISDKNAAASVGSHYNPTNASHGCEDESSPQWHVGDTGNWYVDSTGAITGSKTLSSVLLTGPNSIIGRAVVIHNRTDDCNVTSSSQSRLGFCVIGIGNPALSGTDLTVNDAVSEATYVPIGVCDLQQIGTSGVSGRVWLTPSTEGLKVDAIVYNLTGTHGFHIHQYGDLSQTQNGNSTGGHYNPYNVSHGIPPYKERHLGDLGNIYHELNSTAMAYSYTITEEPYVNLTGLYNVIGRAMIIHSAPDNCSQPTGGAGSRLAYCVIGIGNVTTTSPLAAYTSVPTTQDDNLCKDDSGAVELLVSASLVFWAFMAVLF